MRALVRRVARAAAALLVVAAGLAGGAGAAGASPRHDGAVYVETNAAGGNAVLAFSRDASGALSPAGSYPTGGLGTGRGLGSQGALALSDDRRWLFAVNAGSGDVSVFAVTRGGLRLVDRQPSGGQLPISLTYSDDTLYVLNGGGDGSIAGFSVDDGHLAPIPGAVRPLGHPASGPAEVQFSPDGELLVVTEKATNSIDVYVVDEQGVAQGPVVQPSSGQTPFGFAFDRRGHIIVSEAFGGAAGAGAVSSYDITEDGRAIPVSPSVASSQTAPCWVATTRDGRLAFVANTGSGTISSYEVGRDGALTLRDGGASASTGAGSRPADLTLSRDGRSLYVLNGGAGTIGAFAVGPHGALAALPAAAGVPAGAAGLVAI